MQFSYLTLAGIIFYAVVCIAIGIWSGRKQNNEDYMIAGRRLKTWSFIATVVASYIGGAAIVAFTAYVYKFGISAIAVFLGTATGFLIFIPYALKLRSISDQKQFNTLSDWFYYKYDSRTGLLSAIILFIVYFGMLLNQFIAGSSILANISGWSYEQALLFSSSVITVYLLFGGFLSVVRTDVFQYIIMLLMFVFLTVLIFTRPEHANINLFDLRDMDPGMTVAFIAFGVFIIFQSAEYWQRVYAARDNRVVRNGLAGSAALVIVTGLAISIVGLTARNAAGTIEARDAFAEGMRIMLPPEYIVVALLLLFAAIMSSADTIIFVLASSLSKDYAGLFMKTAPTQSQMMKTTRLFIVLFALLGFVMAYFFRDLVAIIIFITGLGFTIIPAAIASFHMKLNTWVVTASFIAGCLYILILFITGNLIAEASIASIGVAAFVLFAGHLLSLLKKSAVA
jgi:Na+/proline symporter